MNEPALDRPPAWYWIVAGLALLWNLIGVAAYLAEAYDLARQSDVHRQLADSRPAWATAAYALAVFGGALGSLGLLLRRRWARGVLVVALAALLAQQGWAFLLSDAVALLGRQAMLFPLLVVLVALGLVLLARAGVRKGWLR